MPVRRVGVLVGVLEVHVAKLQRVVWTMESFIVRMFYSQAPV